VNVHLRDASSGVAHAVEVQQEAEKNGWGLISTLPSRSTPLVKALIGARSPLTRAASYNIRYMSYIILALNAKIERNAP
jgi:hypothetical protein